MTTSTITNELAIEQYSSNDAHTCAGGWLLFSNGKVIYEQECGVPATHQVLHTCCTHIKYVCDDHAVETPSDFLGDFCVACKHFCDKGACYHRVVMPL